VPSAWHVGQQAEPVREWRRRKIEQAVVVRTIRRTGATSNATAARRMNLTGRICEAEVYRRGGKKVFIIAERRTGAGQKRQTAAGVMRML